MVLGHRRRRHGQQHAIGVDQADLLARGGQTRPAGAPPPRCEAGRAATRITVAFSTHGIFSSCLRRWLKGTKKMLRPMSSPKTGRRSARVTSLRPEAWMSPAAGDAEARIAFKVGLEDVGRRDQDSRDSKCTAGEKDAAPAGCGTPPRTAARLVETLPAGARKFVFVIGIGPRQGHAGEVAARRRHDCARDLLHAPRAGIRGRFIVPGEETVFRTTLSGHA